MVESIEETEDALRRLNLGSPWGNDLKVSEQFLSPVFESFYEKSGMSITSKSNYYFLIDYLDASEIDLEVTNVLDAIYNVSI